MSTSTIGQMLPFHAFHAFEDGNEARSGAWFKHSTPDGGVSDQGDADKARLTLSLAQGFDPSVSMIAVYPLDAGPKKEALAERKAILKRLEDRERDFEIGSGKDKVKISAAQLREAYKLAWSEDGKLVAPDYAVVTGNRRTACVPYILAYCKAAKDLEVPTEWPAVIRHDLKDDPKERAIVSFKENDMKTAGALQMSVSDMLNWALSLFRSQAAEADFTRALNGKRGRAQQLHRLCLLNHRMEQQLPDAKPIIDRICDPEDPADLRQFDKETTKKSLLDLSDSEFNVAAVDKVIMDGGPKPGKIAGKTEITNLGNSGVRLITFTSKAILDNDTGRLTRFEPVAKQINEAVNAICKEAKISFDV